MTRVQLSDAERIVEMAVDVYLDRYPDWSVDTLLLHPDEAKKVCVEARGRLGKRWLTDEEILRSLLNARKRGMTGTVRRERLNAE